MKPSPEQQERTCFMCNNMLAIDENGFQSGYWCCEQYFCGDRCLNKSFLNSGETWEEHYTENGDCYWTEWENEKLFPPLMACPVDPQEALNCEACQ